MYLLHLYKTEKIKLTIKYIQIKTQSDIHLLLINI